LLLLGKGGFFGRAGMMGACGNEGGVRTQGVLVVEEQGNVKRVPAKAVAGLHKDLAGDGLVPGGEVVEETRERRSVVVEDLAEDRIAFAGRDGADDDGVLGADERDDRGGGGYIVCWHIRQWGIRPGELDVLGVHGRWCVEGRVCVEVGSAMRPGLRRDVWLVGRLLTRTSR
jgi:hypothetical protein